MFLDGSVIGQKYGRLEAYLQNKHAKSHTFEILLLFKVDMANDSRQLPVYGSGSNISIRLEFFSRHLRNVSPIFTLLLALILVSTRMFNS